MKKVTFRGKECGIRISSFPNGRVAWQLWADGPNGRATVNIPEHPLEDGQTIIKDYSENQGMLAAFVEAGYVQDTGELADGRTGCHVVNILDDDLKAPS